MNRTATLAAAAAALAVTLAGCASTTAEAGLTPDDVQRAVTAHADRLETVYEPHDTAERAGLDLAVRIASVTETVDAVYYSEPVTVFTFEVTNNGTIPLQPDVWTLPTLTYGPAGISATSVFAAGNHDRLVPYPEQPLMPGRTYTLSVGYKVPVAELTDAALTAGTVTWSGDFTTF